MMVSYFSHLIDQVYHDLLVGVAVCISKSSINSTSIVRVWLKYSYSSYFLHMRFASNDKEKLNTHLHGAEMHFSETIVRLTRQLPISQKEPLDAKDGSLPSLCSQNIFFQIQ